MALVYQHRRKDSNLIFYIGITSNNKNRPYCKQRNKYWKNIVSKYGYIVEILIEDISTEEAKDIEIGLIEYYGRKDLGLGVLVNMTDGGDGTVLLSEDSKKNIKKVVYQYNLKGIFIKKYESIKAASKETNINIINLGKASLSNGVIRTKNFLWTRYYYKKINHFISTAGTRKEVFKYNLNGEYIRGYLSVVNACIDNNIRGSSIYMCCNGSSKSSGGFIWNYKKTKRVKAYKTKSKDGKKIDQYDLNNKYIRSFNTILEAQNHFNKKLNISPVCRGKRKMAGGYIWKYSK